MIRVFVHVRRAAKAPVPVILIRLRRDGPHGLGDRERLNGLVDQSLDGAHYCRTLVVDATHAGTTERIRQSGIAQVGTAQIGITEKRILEVGTGQDGTLEVGIIAAGLTQVGTGHVGVGQVRTGQVGLEYGGPA